MALVAPNDGLPYLLALLMKDAAVPVLDWQLALYSNNYTPTQASVIGNFTVATFTGASIVGLSRGTWQAPALSTNKALIQYGTTPIVWTATGAYQTIYGYFVFELGANKVLIAERFATAVDLNLYPVVGVLPRVTLTTDCGC